MLFLSYGSCNIVTPKVLIMKCLFSLQHWCFKFEGKYLPWKKMSNGDVMGAGCNIVQAVVIQALSEALEQHMKYRSNSVAVTPRLKVLKNGKNLIFFSYSSLCVCKIFCDFSFTVVIVAPPGCTRLYWEYIAKALTAALRSAQ